MKILKPLLEMARLHGFKIERIPWAMLVLIPVLNKHQMGLCGLPIPKTGIYGLPTMLLGIGTVNKSILSAQLVDQQIFKLILLETLESPILMHPNILFEFQDMMDHHGQLRLQLLVKILEMKDHMITMKVVLDSKSMRMEVNTSLI